MSYFSEKDLLIRLKGEAKTVGIECILLSLLPCTLKKMRSILCGLEHHLWLHPYYGLLRGVKRDVFVEAVFSLEKKLLLRVACKSNSLNK